MIIKIAMQNNINIKLNEWAQFLYQNQNEDNKNLIEEILKELKNEK